MLRLSQKAWNNVLIFSMLILIAIFNYDRLFPSNESGVQAVVADTEFILSMQINQLNFERIGTGWRVSAPSADDIPNMQSEDIDALVNQWQRASLRPSSSFLPAEVTASPEYIVSIWVAGQKNAKVLGLLQSENTAYVIYDGDLYLLDFPNLNQLLPPERQ
ncbi:hypothetical protein [Glaciecola sp. SC05]|uniref:hypothetical protein n=1 Tax=Glaciecola sp. SC05 TaxID=1987355 RepID=UPI003528A9F3